MDKYYTIHGLSPALDGVDVQLGGSVGWLPVEDPIDPEMLYEIVGFRNRAVLIGDRQLTFQVVPESLAVKGKYLVKCEYQGEMEFSSENPYGKFRCTSAHKFADRTVTVTEYENCTSVSVDVGDEVASKCEYAQNFFKKDERYWVRKIVEVSCAGLIDHDDIAWAFRHVYAGDFQSMTSEEKDTFSTTGEFPEEGFEDGR